MLTLYSDREVVHMIFNLISVYFLFQSIKAYCVYQPVQAFKLILLSLIPYLIIYPHQVIQQNRDYKNILKHSLWKRTKYSLIDKVINTLPEKTQQGKKNTIIHTKKFINNHFQLKLYKAIVQGYSINITCTWTNQKIVCLDGTG